MEQNRRESDRIGPTRPVFDALRRVPPNEPRVGQFGCSTCWPRHVRRPGTPRVTAELYDIPEAIARQIEEAACALVTLVEDGR